MGHDNNGTRGYRLIAVAAGLAAMATAASAEPRKVAVFDFQFARGAPVPPTQDDLVRLKRTSDQFRTLLKESGRYTLIPSQSLEAETKDKDLRACGGCADDLGRRLGADATFVGEVQKVSNLILNMNVYMKPTQDGSAEQAFSVDMRGDTDESFDRGIRSLVKNQLMERAK